MNKIALKEYKDSTTYITIMLIIFILSVFYSPYRQTDIGMALIISSIYGFVIGSGIYFGFLYGYKKLIEKN